MMQANALAMACRRLYASTPLPITSGVTPQRTMLSRSRTRSPASTGPW